MYAENTQEQLTFLVLIPGILYCYSEICNTVEHKNYIKGNVSVISTDPVKP